MCRCVRLTLTFYAENLTNILQSVAPIGSEMFKM